MRLNKLLVFSFLIIGFVSCEKANIEKYNKMEYKYMKFGDVTSFTTSDGRTMNISITSEKASDEFDFEIIETREWDNRKRRYGYKDSCLYYLSIEVDYSKYSSSNHKKEVVSFRALKDEGAISEYPIYFSSKNKSYRNQVVVEGSKKYRKLNGTKIITTQRRVSENEISMSFRISSSNKSYTSSFVCSEDGVQSVSENGKQAYVSGKKSFLKPIKPNLTNIKAVLRVAPEKNLIYNKASKQ